jgi:hypothetical protein
MPSRCQQVLVQLRCLVCGAVWLQPRKECMHCALASTVELSAFGACQGWGSDRVVSCWWQCTDRSLHRLFRNCCVEDNRRRLMLLVELLRSAICCSNMEFNAARLSSRCRHVHQCLSL